MNEGIERAAILMMALGEEEAAAVLRHLAPKDVQRLGETITKLKSVPRDRVVDVLAAFSDKAAEQHTLVADTDAYVSKVLRLALGDDKAKLLIDRIVKTVDASGIDTLRWMDTASITALLRHEHPQIVAAILAHLDAEQGSAVLKQFDEPARNQVLARIATLDAIQPSAMRELNDMMSQVLSKGGSASKGVSAGGPKTAGAIINLLGPEVEASALGFIRESDAELAQTISDSMLIFDDLVKIDDKGIQAVLKEVQSDALVVALKGASQALSEKIFKNMSSRAAESLKEDLESRGPVRLSEVEGQQKEILQVVRRLADEGQLMLGGGGGEQFV